MVKQKRIQTGAFSCVPCIDLSCWLDYPRDKPGKLDWTLIGKSLNRPQVQAVIPSPTLPINRGALSTWLSGGRRKIFMETRWKSLKLLLLMILDDMVATSNEKNLLCGWNNVKKRLHSVLDPKCCLVHLQKNFQQLLNWNYLLMRWARFTKVSKCRWHVSKGRDLEKRISFHNTRKDNVLKPSNLQKTLKRKGKRICATTMLKMILIFYLPIPECAVWAVWFPRK